MFVFYTCTDLSCSMYVYVAYLSHSIRVGHDFGLPSVAILTCRKALFTHLHTWYCGFLFCFPLCVFGMFCCVVSAANCLGLRLERYVVTTI